MPDHTLERNTCSSHRPAVAGFLLFLIFAMASPSLASVTDTSWALVSLREVTYATSKKPSPYQQALARYNTGQREEALKLWLSHAQQGDPEAQFTLGVLYNRGGGGLPWDMIAAVHWYHKAAQQGHIQAQYNLGILCATGNGVARDIGAAMRWWYLAATQGFAEAQFNLGLYFAEGKGVPPNPVAAVKWWGLAAEQGLAEAQFNLGLMYMLGEGTDENLEEAIRLWRLSANQGYSQAISVLKTLQLDP